MEFSHTATETHHQAQHRIEDLDIRVFCGDVRDNESYFQPHDAFDVQRIDVGTRTESDVRSHRKRVPCDGSAARRA